MNTNHDNRQQTIERLVDGELSIDEEREMLSSFERDPSGWRALAEMFLEDRILTESLERETQAACSSVERPAAHARRTVRTNTLAKFVSVSILILAAFVSGRYSAASLEPTATAHVAEAERTESVTFEPAAAKRQLPPTVEFVTLSLSDAGDNAPRIDVPLVPWEHVAASYASVQFVEPEPLVPDEIREILARRGQTIDARMSYVPFETPDGRTGVIPVSRIELRSNRFPEIQ
ncbi:MAG TPA: hypothetical protein VMM56_14170 [Planctomycetaceae bacterium]|nr:hypothetical protein [Planctomycetaceae bacterium]